MKKILALILVVGFWWTSLSWSGMLMIQKNSSGDTMHWACEDGLFRTGTDEFYTVMDANKQVIYTIMVKERQYTVTTPEDVRRQMEAMQKQMEQMQSSMEALSKKFKGLGKLFGKSEPEEETPPPEPKVTYKSTGEKARIAGYKARKILELQDGRPVAELWVSEALARDIMGACNYKKLEKMFKAMAPEGQEMPAYQKGQGQSGVILKEEGVFGFPIKIVDLEGGEVIQLIKAEKKKIPRSYFQVPAGFRKVNYQAGPMMGKPF